MNAHETEDLELLQNLRSYWNLGMSKYKNDFKKMNMLDQTDRGELWKATGMKFPSYQILPDTNWVTYVKSNLLASIYSVVKSAEVVPTSEEDKELCTNLNIILDAVWDTQKVGFYQFQAGERAALLNVGITQVGWDEDLVIGSGDNIKKGDIRLKNINPTQFMRDPYAVSLDTAAWCVTFDNFHQSVLLNNSLYKDSFKKYQAKAKDGKTEPFPTPFSPDGITKDGGEKYYSVLVWHIRNDDGSVTEVHTVNLDAVIHKKEKIEPSMFPYAMLYCNLPSGALVGTSEPAKIFANNLAYNIMDSLALTAEYRNQNPPKFISTQSNLNVKAFSKHGNDANKVFVVAGDSSKAVHYQQYPQVSPFLATLKMSMENGIQSVSGVDGRYTGRDTGSIITTGGTEEMLNRVTLIDTPKITMYEDYVKVLTQLIVLNLIKYCPKRKFYRKEDNSTKYKTVEVDFPKLDKKTILDYRVSISSELPKNKQRTAAAATELLKAQAQYRQQGSDVNWITEEEWLMFQDLPFKEYMLERMGVQRLENALQDVAQVLYQYSDLVSNGATPDEAMQATAETLKQTRAGVAPELAAGPNPDLQAMAQEIQ